MTRGIVSVPPGGADAGDLAVSVRKYNLVAVIDPDIWRAKWHQIGPWLRQHDPEFHLDGTLTLFNNGTFRTWFAAFDRPKPDKPLVSSIMRVTPGSGDVTTVYGQRPGQEFRSIIRSKHDPLPNGHFLITEFEAGRAFEVDAAGRTVWEYINRYDADRVVEITEARAYDEDYFTVSDWSCPDP